MRPFYLGTPTSDGVFVVDLKRDQFVDGVSLYRFEPIKDDERKANFCLYDAPGVYRMISKSWESCVKPVCDYDNYPEKLVDGIETVTKGEAKLLPSGNWRMIKKAKIEYTESDEPDWYKKDVLGRAVTTTDVKSSRPKDEDDIDNTDVEENITDIIGKVEVDNVKEVIEDNDRGVTTELQLRLDTKTGFPIFDSKPISASPPIPVQTTASQQPLPSPSAKIAKNNIGIIGVVLGFVLICAVAVYFISRPSVEKLFNNGKESFDAKNFTEAVTYFSKAIKRNPDNVEFRCWRGRAYYEQNEYESAVADFKEAVRLSPKTAEYHHWLGEAYFGMKNYESAVTVYTQAIKLEPDNANHYFSRAGAYSAQKAYKTAIDDFTQAIRLDPKDARYYNSRGGDYRNLGDYDKAYVDHSDAIRLNPSDAKYRNNRGVAQVLRKNYVEAIPDFSEAIRLSPDNARYYNNRGDAYVLTKEIALAVADYRMAVRYDSGNATYLRNLEKTEQRLSAQEEPVDSRDNQRYRAVKIGAKIWMSQNMNYRPSIGNSWCYDNNSSNCDKYGRLYDWNAAKTACPSGWHLPSRKEWKELVTAVGVATVVGKKLKVVSPEWNGTDEYKFSAQPGGYRNDDGSFSAVGTDGSWWTATESNNNNAYLRYMSSDYESVLEMEYDKSNGFSVRCVMDAR